MTAPLAKVIDALVASPATLRSKRNELAALRARAEGVLWTSHFWLDPQDRVVREFAPAPDIPGVPRQKATLLTFSRFGESVIVEVPPASATKDIDATWGAKLPPGLD